MFYYKIKLVFIFETLYSKILGEKMIASNLKVYP